MQRRERLAKLGLACARSAWAQEENLCEFGLGMKAEDIIERKLRVRVHPAEHAERRERLMRTSDFIVEQFACAKIRSHAHQHSNQQRPRCQRQSRKFAQENTLVFRKKIVVTIREPLERALEIQQVIEPAL